jgi:acetoin utilization deacetylase AcuC-like enzyme
MMQVSTTGFADMVKSIKGLADELCDGRLVFCLEGGYHLRAVSCSVKATFDVLLDTNIEDPLGQSGGFRAPDIVPLIKVIKEIHSLA